jgi:hypothetical protein
MVKITVIKDTRKGYGFNLCHNMNPGFQGIISNVWAWYRYKKDAIKAAQELEKAWN